MAQEIQGPLQPDARGEMPMDKKMTELRTDPRVTMFLLPLPRSAAKDSDKPAASASTPKAGAPQPLRPSKKARPSAKAKCARKSFEVSNNGILQVMLYVGLSI